MNATRPRERELLDLQEDLSAVRVVAGVFSVVADLGSAVAGAWTVVCWRRLQMVAAIDGENVVADGLAIRGGGVHGFVVS